MDIELEDPNFLGNFLDEVEGGAGVEDINFGLTQDTQNHEEVQVVSSKKKAGTAKRKKNFHWKEDIVICSGWLLVSKDPIHGANQTRSSFWGRIHAYYKEHNKTDAVRTTSSIMHRWFFIQWSVNKFCSAYDAILRRNQSGLTIEDKVCNHVFFYFTGCLFINDIYALPISLYRLLKQRNSMWNGTRRTKLLFLITVGRY
jgi:hypothetical protein